MLDWGNCQMEVVGGRVKLSRGLTGIEELTPIVDDCVSCVICDEGCLVRRKSRVLDGISDKKRCEIQIGRKVVARSNFSN